MSARTARRLATRVLRTADGWAPGVAAAYLEKQWWRVPVAPAARTSRAPTPYEVVRVARGPLDLQAHVFGPPTAPLAYAVHGWGGWWQQMIPVIRLLVDAGYRVVAYDAPQHGQAGQGAYGRTTRVMEMAAAYEAVVEHVGPSSLTVAHSVGAMAVMWAHESGTPADAFVLFSPAIRMGPLIGWLAQAFGAGPRAERRLGQRLETTLRRPLADFDVTGMLGRIDPAAPPPMLAVHDVGDPQTPAADTKELVAAWPGAALLLTDGPGHLGVLRQPAVLTHVGTFVQGLRRPPASRDSR